ncbi:MAG: holo-ACP synthase [Chloroflexi bacterium]|nr:holo-ACP synthase [Chloroflexota bacterium]
MPRIGVDIIEIARVEKAVARWQKHFLDHIFTGAELECCSGRPQSLAARFAAKEAVMKALGCGFKGPPWTEIEVLPDADGMPTVRLTGRVLQRAGHLRITQVLVSLSHSDSHAIAYVHAY